jgi:hypothetical protein
MRDPLIQQLQKSATALRLEILRFLKIDEMLKTAKVDQNLLDNLG